MFDRIRENSSIYRRVEYERVVNHDRYQEFEWVAVEQKFDAPAIETRDVEGWAFWELDKIEVEKPQPVVLKKDVASDAIKVPKGHNAGSVQYAYGIVKGKKLITMDFKAYIGAPEELGHLLQVQRPGGELPHRTPGLQGLFHRHGAFKGRRRQFNHFSGHPGATRQHHRPTRRLAGISARRLAPQEHQDADYQHQEGEGHQQQGWRDEL